MRRFVARYSPLFILAGLGILLALAAEKFGRPDNLQNVAYRTAVVGIVATGQTLVILTAGIDLSVASVAALSGVVSALLMTDLGLPIAPAVAAGALVGLVCGLINGTLVTKGKIPPFIVTLGMMMVARGAALLITGGEPIYGLPDAFRYLGGVRSVWGHRGWWIPVLITVAITALFAVMLTFTRLGRAVYATGGNSEGARLSGISVSRVRLVVYGLCGLLSGFGGVMLAAKVGIADGSAAEGMELDAIAACVIGGASLMGGEGGCVGTLAGALIMIVLVNFCNLKEFDPHWQKVLVGSLIIVLVYYDSMRKRKAGLLRD